MEYSCKYIGILPSSIHLSRLIFEQDFILRQHKVKYANGEQRDRARDNGSDSNKRARSQLNRCEPSKTPERTAKQRKIDKNERQAAPLYDSM